MAAGSTYTPIATTTGTGSSGTITFTSIPSTYTDLRIILNGTETNATLYEFDMRYNNDSGNNYSLTWRSTSAINRIDLTPIGSFVQYSQAALYGIKG